MPYYCKIYAWTVTLIQSVTECCSIPIWLKRICILSQATISISIIFCYLAPRTIFPIPVQIVQTDFSRVALFVIDWMSIQEVSFEYILRYDIFIYDILYVDTKVVLASCLLSALLLFQLLYSLLLKDSEPGSSTQYWMLSFALILTAMVISYIPFNSGSFWSLPIK